MTQGEIRSAFPTSMLVDPTVHETRSFHNSKSIEGKDRQGTRGFLLISQIVFYSFSWKKRTMKLTRTVRFDRKLNVGLCRFRPSYHKLIWKPWLCGSRPIGPQWSGSMGRRSRTFTKEIFRKFRWWQDDGIIVNTTRNDRISAAVGIA